MTRYYGVIGTLRLGSEWTCRFRLSGMTDAVMIRGLMHADYGVICLVRG